MDLLILAIVLFVCAVVFGIGIYFLLMKVIRTEAIQVFSFSLMIMILVELMVLVFLSMCVIRISGLL